jgi:hypothetical protein
MYLSHEWTFFFPYVVLPCPVADPGQNPRELNFTAGSTFVFNLCPVSNASFLSSNGRTFMAGWSLFFFPFFLSIFLLSSTSSSPSPSSYFHYAPAVGGLEPPSPPVVLEPVVTTEFMILELACSRPGSLSRACALTCPRSTEADNI